MIHMPSASPVLSIAIGTMMALPGVGSRCDEVVEPGVEPDVAADRQAGLLDEREQRVVALVVVVGEAELGREHRELQRLRAERGDALHLGHRAVDVLDRDLVRHDQARRVGRREVAQHLVERDRRVVLALRRGRPSSGRS